MQAQRAIVVGAGIGGLVGALELACAGLEVTVLERAPGPGGKLRAAQIGGAAVDSGPTVLTMRWVFEEIFARAGTSLESRLALRQSDILARHLWGPDQRLDLFTETDRSVDAIGRFAGAQEAQGYRRFCQAAERAFRALDFPFMRAQRPSVLGMGLASGAGGLADMLKSAPFSTLWRELGRYFRDPRLRQLFGRYSTYCGSSPFEAPAILMLIAHVEKQGVWLVDGGMRRVATALAELAQEHGAKFRYGAHVESIAMHSGRASGVILAGGEQIEADAVLFNGDVAALAEGRLGVDAIGARPAATAAPRSLSAITWALKARTSGLDLVRHNVFFSNDYRREFEELFGQSRLAAAPTIYVCAQDRADGGEIGPGAPERLLCLVNAPARGESSFSDRSEVERCEARIFSFLEHCGLHIERSPEATVVTTPADFSRLYPASGGALYGRATHGWQSSFRRPGATTRLPGLFLAGGSVHPGAGLPMAALSGHLAAEMLQRDLASIRPSVATAMRGGTSMRSAWTAPMASR